MASIDKMEAFLIASITEQKEKEQSANIWAESDWKDVATLENNNVGLVGENFVRMLCAEAGILADIDGSKTKQIGGGAGDGTIKTRTVEIKTARQGTSGTSFQHELGEKPWLASFMMFVDISPKEFYLTVFPNFTEDEYKSSTKCPRVFPTKSITWRKKSGAFKLDTTVAINRQKSIDQGDTFRWSPDTSIESFKAFIDRIIPNVAE